MTNPNIMERINEVRYTAYPFVENSLMSGVLDLDSSAVPLTNDVVLDVRAVNYAREFGRLSLDSVTFPSATSALFYIMYTDPAGANLMATADVPCDAASWETMEIYETTLHLAGVWSLFLTFGPGVVGLASGRTGGTAAFTGLYMEPSCIRVRNRHVVNSMEGDGAVITGAVKIMEGYNMAVSVNTGGNSIRLSPIIGEGLGMPCEQVLPDPGNCDDLIYRLNGCMPDWNGDLVLQGGPGISVAGVPASNKVVLFTPFMTCDPGCVDDPA